MFCAKSRLALLLVLELCHCTFSIGRCTLSTSFDEDLSCSGLHDIPTGARLLQATRTELHQVLIDKIPADTHQSQHANTYRNDLHKFGNVLMSSEVELTHATDSKISKGGQQRRKPAGTEHSGHSGDAKEEEETDRSEARIVACVGLYLIAVFCLVHRMHEADIHVLPEQAVIILFGVLLGLFLKYGEHASFLESAGTGELIHPSEYLCMLLLPPLLFESGWMMRRLDFMSQLPYILNFALLGTLISIFVIGGLIYHTGHLGLHELTSYRSALAIGAILSTTEPVATLGTYAHLQVDPLLNIIVFGEAALNDAVAVVVFHILNKGGGSSGLGITLEGLLVGTVEMVGSFAVGLGLTVAICWMLRLVDLHKSKKVEILIIVITAYVAFALGEYFHFSGIIATIFNGIFMGVYARPHLSMEGSLLTSFLLGELCTVMDATISLLIGVVALFVYLNQRGFSLGLWLMLFCMVGRLCSTYPCGWLSNYMKDQFGKSQDLDAEDCHMLSSKHLFMIWHAGLRGAISLWLALHIGDWMDEEDGEGTRLAVQSSIIVLIATFIIVFGGTTRPCLRWLHVSMGHDCSDDELSQTEIMPWASRMTKWLHQNVFNPLLVGNDTALNMSHVRFKDEKTDVEKVLHRISSSRRAHYSHAPQPMGAAQTIAYGNEFRSAFSDAAGEEDGDDSFPSKSGADHHKNRSSNDSVRNSIR